MFRVASKNIKFGLNKNINYYGTIRKNKPKKIHQDMDMRFLTATSRLDNLDNSEQSPVTKHKVLSISSE